MNQKGSRQNPYWSNEFTDLYNQNRWTGGWVLSANGGSKDYYRSNAVPLRAYENGVLGSLDKPFTESVYNEMVSNGTWTGGWVEITDIDTMSTVYMTEDQIPFSKENNEGIILGEHGNPVYLWMYDEMDANDIWFGGWVVYGDSATEYISGSGNNNSGSGCGCGSSGSGSGSGGMSGHGNLSAGTEQKLYFLFNDPSISARITFSWDAGSFNALDAQPSIYISDIICPAGVSLNIDVSWAAAFLVQLDIHRPSSDNLAQNHVFEHYSIPEHYRS